MAKGSPGEQEGENDPLSLVGRSLTGRSLKRQDPADELVLLWRALLVLSGDQGAAEAALVATVEACGPWSDPPHRLEIWEAGFQALEAEQRNNDVLLLGDPDVGPRSAEVKAITDFLDGSAPVRRRLLLGHHVGGMTTSELQRFVADQPGGRDLDQDQVAEWIKHDSRVAAQTLAIKPQHWSELLALLWPPVHPDRLLRGESRSWRTGATVGGLLVVIGLFVALFSLNGGAASLDGDPEDASAASEADAGTGSAGDAAGTGGSQSAQACLAMDLVSRVSVSSDYQAGLMARPFPEVLAASDMVVRGAVSSIELEGGGIRFELRDPQPLFGAGPSPSSFFFNARFDATGDQIPNGELFADAVVFLNQTGDRWEVAEAGGLWVGCEDTLSMAVGADWPVGSQWPPLASPAELARVINETLQENARFAMIEDGERTAGGFQLFDGRSLLLQLPSGMQPTGEMSAVIRPLPDVLAIIGGPEVRLVIREEECDPAEQARAPLAVCSSDGQTVVEIASPLELSEAWLGRIDVFIIDGSSDPGRPVLSVKATRSGELVAIDSVDLLIEWRASLRPGEEMVNFGRAGVAVLADGNLRVLDLFSGQEQWARKVSPVTGAVLSGQNWLVAAPADNGGALELVDGRSGTTLWTAELGPDPRIAFVDEELILIDLWVEQLRKLVAYSPLDAQLLWSTEPERRRESAGPTLVVDQLRRMVVTLDGERMLRAVGLGDGRALWITNLPTASSIDGLGAATMTLNDVDGGLITINLSDGSTVTP